MADKDKRRPEDFDPLEWVETQPNIADAIGISERALRNRPFDFILHEQQVNKDGSTFGKPVWRTVVCSGTAAEAKYQQTVAAALPENKAKAGIASGESRRAKVFGPYKL